MARTTIGRYLVRRLEQAGVKHIFGVPGDYVLQFFDYLEESSIQVVGTCNELNAGYAADAYARLNGVGAVCVTYGVGGFSLFNAVAGAFAERVPMIVISGSPRLSVSPDRHLLHHTIGDMNLQYRMYEKITVASVILKYPDQAPRQIDATIAACLRSRRPVYLEIPMDMVTKPCREPGSFTVDTSIHSDQEVLDEAIAEAVTMLTAAQQPVILAGVEVHRLGLHNTLLELVNRTGYPFATTILGKSVIPEQHPQFAGVYKGALGQETTRRTVEEADVVLSLGALMTDVNLGIWTARLEPAKLIAANSDNVRIKHHLYPQVSLEDFITGLVAQLPQGQADLETIEHPWRILKEAFTPVPDQKITVKRFYQRINRIIDGHNIVLADTGDSIFSASELFLPEAVVFIGQAFYLSIGYSVPATLGAKLAAPERRPITFVGDGAFQMTAQELSTIIRHGQNPIIFLMNNDGYTIERMILEGPYNDLHMWQYHLLPQVFNGGWGCVVQTEGELEDALHKAHHNPETLAFIEVRLDRWDCSESLQKLGKKLR